MDCRVVEFPAGKSNFTGEIAAELAEAMDVSRQTINAIETERYTPSLPLALALARFFALTVEEVFHDNSNS